MTRAAASDAARLAAPLLAACLAAACLATACAGGGAPREAADGGAGTGSGGADASTDAASAAPVDGIAASADGVPIHYRAAGRGSPALVLVHGWSCDAGTWSETFDAARGRRRVVAIDLAGHGASGSGRSRWTIPAFADDVGAVLDDLGLDRVVLAGHSMGGLVAVEVARRQPERVAAIIAVDTLHDAEYQWPADEFEALLESLRVDFPAAASAFVRGMFPDGADADLVERVASDIASAPSDVAVAVLRGVFAYDLTGALPQVRAPIRCINGDRQPTRVEVNRRYAPDFDAVIMGGVGHFPMLESPREFRRLLARVMDGVAPVAGGE